MNLQLSRYIFDLKTFTKRKTLAKVRLPRTISIPIETSEEKYTTTTTYPDRLNSKRRRTNGNGNKNNYNINTNSKLTQKEYILCGVVS
ncbi:MAG: hypothetical protein ACK53Y_08525, partial [bacterium]